MPDNVIRPHQFEPEFSSSEEGVEEGGLEEEQKHDDENSRTIICFYCGEPDSVLHTFQSCRATTSFHNQLLNWFNGMHNTSISPANYEFFIWYTMWEG